MQTKKSANHALNLLQYIMAKLDLKLHPVKTKIVSMWDGKEEFDFLGMHHRRMTRGTYQSKLAGRLFSTFCMVRSVHKFFTKN